MKLGRLKPFRAGSKPKNRLAERGLAAFLLVLFLASSVVMPGTAYGLAIKEELKTPKIPGSLATVDSKNPVAKDAQAAKDNKNLLGADKTQAPGVQGSNAPKLTFDPHELVEERTATSSVKLNKDGSKTQTNYVTPHFYKKAGKWETIKPNLIEDTNSADSANIAGKALGKVQGLLGSKQRNFKMEANDWQARFAPSKDGVGMVRIQYGSETVTLRPVNAANVLPEKTTDSTGKEVVRYKDLWPGIDVEYQTKSSMLKEFVILKDKNAQSNYSFQVDGASLTPDPQTPGGFKLKGALQDKFEVAPLSVSLMQRGPISESVTKQEFKDGKLAVTVDKNWLKNLPTANFPVVIDPTFNSFFGNRGSGNYVAYKSDGYVCGSTVCYPNAGTLNDNGWKSWRSNIFAPYNQLQGKQLLGAWFHLQQMPQTSGKYFGGTEARYFQFLHAGCMGYNCIDGSAPVVTNLMANGFDTWFDATSLYQTMINRGDWGAWMMIKGEEVGYNTFKSFDPDNSYMQFTYNTPPPAPGLVSPSADNQTFIDPVVAFKANTVGDADGDAVQYSFRISTSPNGGGLVVDSGRLSTPQWTVPDGVLQDGNTYYVRAVSFDGTNEGLSSTRPFKIDMRRGKDKTQTYDTLGPVTVDMATGNLSASASSHTSSALGGSLGVSLDYNSPLRSRQGLVGEYWNIPANSGVDPPARAADIVRVDQNVDFNWGQGSPVPGTIGNDWYYGRWTGYFTAPATGTYSFGGNHDDYLGIYVNDQQLYSNGGCYTGVCYGSTVTLTAGQVVSFRAQYLEGTWTAYNHLYVKGPVPEQVIPQDWLQTGARPVSQNNGLTGRYYTDSGNHTIPSDGTGMFLSRTDPQISFGWDTASPIPNGPTDNFMVRWAGYITAPTTGSYTFGVNADDGARINVNNTQVFDQWNSCCGLRYGNTINLTAGQSVPIVVDYNEATGPAYMNLYVKGTVSEQVVPTSWLSPKSQVLPNGWNLGIDPDGDLNYDHLLANQNSVILTDSTGATHEYTWTGSGYKPPVNEDGQLTRSTDGSYTLQDTDGKTYSFSSAGILTAVTNPTDDRKPAALQYSYTGSPARISQITDGTTSGRFAKVLYSGDSGCGSAPSGFDPAAPTGMLCAVQTNDNRNTYFYYKDGNLARILRPGNEAEDYQYDTLGRIISLRDTAANDAIGAGVRTADDTTLTQVSYDNLGRVKSVTQPAATATATRQNYSYDYKLSSVNFGRYVNGQDHAMSVRPPGAGYNLEGWFGTLLFDQAPGTIPIYSCMSSWDEFVSPASNCEGQAFNGLLGYIYSAQPADIPTKAIYRCTVNGTGDHIISLNADCEGQHLEWMMGYILAPEAGIATTVSHEANVTEPNGFIRRVNYDGLFRTTRDTDIANLSTTQSWDPVKDLSLATTDSTGIMSTTIYDDEDRPISQYGGAPTAWFGGDRKPLAAYVSQVPRNDTGYDEGVTGSATTWFNVKGSSFYGGPKVHTTGIDSADPTHLGRDFRTGTLPFTPDPTADGYGFSTAGKVRFPATGTYTLRLWHDDGARVSIDDQAVIDDWAYRSEGIGQNLFVGTFNATAGTPYRFQFDYLHTGNPGGLELWVSGPGISDTGPAGLGTSKWTMLNPDYGLTTSQTVYDSQLGNTKTTTDYGTKPELGLTQATHEDVTGQNRTTTFGYEAPGAGFLRQTSKMLPGGNTTGYQYYAANDTADNPCTPEVESYNQGGALKGKTDPDPDGSGPQASRTTESIYDDSGKVVATRVNNDPWTCTTYDVRNRTLKTTVPAFNGNAARTITNDYAVGGNPQITQTVDDNGATTTQVDLLGRIVSYTDSKGNTTQSTYDGRGRLQTRTSPLGAEETTYDQFGRQVDQKLDGIVLAHTDYDQYSRIASVSYPGAGSQKLTGMSRDDLGRITGLNYVLGNGTTPISDTLTRSQTNQILSGTSNGQAYSYSYDATNHLTQAVVAGTTYGYDYSAPSNSVCNQAGSNLLANKNSNRTSFTVTAGATTTTTRYCYNQADQLVWSDDATIGTPVYDTHGNTTQLGSGATTTAFSYDASDRNIGIIENGSGKSVSYTRDAQNRLVNRTTKTNGTVQSNLFYGYTSDGDTPDLVKDASGTVVEKYLSLPGNVIMTVRPNQSGNQQKTYSLPNIHGDVMATTDAAGGLLSTTITGPFGEKMTGQATPGNALLGATYSYVGQNEKLTESNFALQPMQMGSRVYIASLGRFLQVDPQDGGTDNSYVYASDPVNEFDLDGTAINWRSIGKVAAVVGGIAGALACGASVICGVVVGAAASAAFYAAGTAGTKKFSWLGLAGHAAVGGVLGGGTFGLASKAMSGVKSGIYIGRSGGKLYAGQSVNVARRLTQHVAKQKMTPTAARNAWRIPITNNKAVRETYETLVYKALGSKRAPWVANRQVPRTVKKWRFW